MARNSIKQSGLLFTPPVVRKIAFDSAFTEPQTLNFLSSSALLNTSSFEYDTFKVALKNTQEVPIDYSGFENHTFFNSAESKVNVAFEKIINGFPFDGTQTEYENFFTDLRGYEKYVYNNVPKSLGALIFSGTTIGEGPASGYLPDLGTYINVADAKGSRYTSTSKQKDGVSALDPGTNTIVFEFHIFAPPEANYDQVILQKKKNVDGWDYGYTIGLKETTAVDQCDLAMVASSGSAIISASMPIAKGRFEHIVAMYDRRDGSNVIKLFTSGTHISSSPTSYEFSNLDISRYPLLIGSGTAHVTASVPTGPSTSAQFSFIPRTTLSGAMDELRVFHSYRSVSQQIRDRTTNIFPDTGGKLRLYFKFNEPTGSFGNNNLVLDSSGNALHSKITNFTSANRERRAGFTDSLPLELEAYGQNPVLFPRHPDLISLNQELLLSASRYDMSNPNLITKLVPSHYFIEGQYDRGFKNEMGEQGAPFNSVSRNIPGGGSLGSAQLLASVLYLWAEQFDQIKIFIDHFAKLRTVDYTEQDTMANKFLPLFASLYGFQLPNLYRDSDVDQYVKGENIQPDRTVPLESLRSVQNQIWRRLLVNLPSLIRAKGTQHAIRGVIRAAGLNPDHNFRIREFGGATIKRIGRGRERVIKHLKMLNFSASMNRDVASGIISAQGVNSVLPFVISPFLSSSRSEIGAPQISGDFIDESPFTYEKGYMHGISNNSGDGLMTSGSFTFEGIYRYPKGRAYEATSSLLRVSTTASAGTTPEYPRLLANLLAVSSSAGLGVTGSVQLKVRPYFSSFLSVAPTLSLVLTGVNIFDGDPYYVAWGRRGKEEIKSNVSSSYFLTVAKANGDEVVEHHMATSQFQEGNVAYEGGQLADTFGIINPSLNVSGAFFAIGRQVIPDIPQYCLNASDIVGPFARETYFSGQVRSLRFYSKALSRDEIFEHVRNPYSFGTDNPFISTNDISINESGSFQRLRVNASMEQPVTAADNSGNITITDFSQTYISGSRILPANASDVHNGSYFQLRGSGFEPDTRAIQPATFYYSRIDPKFDERATDNKIRVRGFTNYHNVDQFDSLLSPVTELDLSEPVTDDTRFIIEQSAVRALNDDIIRIFAVLDEFDRLLGDANLVFAEEYPRFRFLRDVYFKRLESKMNFKKLFEFFRWFDDSLGLFLENFIPYKTDFFGIQFMIESHILERAKFSYTHYDQYIKLGHMSFWELTKDLYQLASDDGTDLDAVELNE